VVRWVFRIALESDQDWLKSKLTVQRVPEQLLNRAVDEGSQLRFR